MFKANNKYIRTASSCVTLVYFLLKTNLFHIFFFIEELEQAIVVWVITFLSFVK